MAAKKTAKPAKAAKPKPAKQPKQAVPKTFAGQLGVKEGNLVICLHCKEQFFAKLRSQMPRYARAFQVVGEDKTPDVIVRFFNEQADFESSFRWLSKRLAPDGIIWAVLPKKVNARNLRKEMTIAAKREGLIEGKKMEFSLTEMGICLRRKK